MSDQPRPLLPRIRVTFTRSADGTNLAVVYRCSADSFETDQRPVAHFVPEELREHLVDEHPGVIPLGRCAKCGVITDDFRAVAPGIGEQWLCERDAPSLPVVVDQAGAGDEGPVFEQDAPFNVLGRATIRHYEGLAE